MRWGSPKWILAVLVATSACTKSDDGELAGLTDASVSSTGDASSGSSEADETTEAMPDAGTATPFADLWSKP